MLSTCLRPGHGISGNPQLGRYVEILSSPQ